jgi:hypothetical protein
MREKCTMSEAFDPYYKWLGIPPKDQPPNHYRLLGLEAFEWDSSVISNAADRQMRMVRTFQTGKWSKQSQALLNEISAARVCLLDPQRKTEYDRRLAADPQAVETPPPIAEPPPLSGPPQLPMKPAQTATVPPPAVAQAAPPTLPGALSGRPTWLYVAVGIRVEPGRPDVFRLRFSEQARDAVSIRKFGSSGSASATLATEAKGTLVIDLVAHGETFWQHTIKGVSPLHVEGEINDATVRAEMLESLTRRLKNVDIPYFTPESRDHLALPIVLE